MLRKNLKSKNQKVGGRFAIVAAQYNARFVNGMLGPAKARLAQAGAQVRIVRVPGAFEIPVVAARLARMEPKFSAIICLGCILRGETVHAQQIGDTVARSLAQLQMHYDIPVIHQVLLLENKAQAKARCLSKEHNRGAEAAQTALEMAAVIAGLPLPE